MGKTKFLVVVDVQNDFTNGVLGSTEARNAIPEIVNKICNFDGNAIFVTYDTHAENYMVTREGRNLPVEHCVKGTHGWEIFHSVQDALDVAKAKGINVITVEKPTFGSYDLITEIDYYVKSERRNGADTQFDIEFVGFCTDICVVSNVLLTKAKFYEDANITVDASCCAGVTPLKHEAALDTMRSCQVNVVND